MTTPDSAKLKCFLLESCTYCIEACVLLVTAAGIILAAPLRAAEVTRVGVEHRGGLYTLHYEVQLDAPAEPVRVLLRDIDQLIQLAPDVEAYEVLSSSGDGITEVHVTTRSCIGPFCMRVAQHQRLDARRAGYLDGAFLPGDSDISGGYSVLEVFERDGKTRLRFQASLQPQFWIPPLIGQGLLTRSLAEQARRFATSLERYIQVQASSGQTVTDKAG